MEILPLKQNAPLDSLPKIARIGLLALASDFCLEDDLRLMLPSDFTLYTNRVTNQTPLSMENLIGMKADIVRSAQALLPDDKPHAYIYGCTSGTAAIGYDQICGDIRNAVGNNVPVITPLSAAFDGLNALKAKRISLLTPYNEQISRDVANNFEQAGFQVDRLSFFNLDDDYHIYRISLDEWQRTAIKAQHPQSDALFISCTSTRTASIASSLEKKLSCSVITSNQALIFGVLQSFQYPLTIKGYGRLLDMDP